MFWLLLFLIHSAIIIFNFIIIVLLSFTDYYYFFILIPQTVHGLAQDWGISIDEAEKTLKAWWVEIKWKLTKKKKNWIKSDTEFHTIFDMIRVVLSYDKNCFFRIRFFSFLFCLFIFICICISFILFVLFRHYFYFFISCEGMTIDQKSRTGKIRLRRTHRKKGLYGQY